MTIKIGTASWTDKSLIASKRFYPPGISSAESRLRYYAAQFDIVEVDSSYYAMPSAGNSKLWVERTPQSFTFNMKAWRLFTGHPTKPETFPKDLQPHLPTTKKNLYYRDIPADLREELWLRYIDAIAPLADADRLGAVLLQMAPWVINNRDGKTHVEECVQHLTQLRVAVEFRNRTWLDDQHRDGTLQWERELGVAHVVVDAPQVNTSNVVPPVWEATTGSLATVRLHGRNHGTWNLKTESASDRFNYDYNQSELVELAAQIKTLAKDVDMVHVIFNNNYEDQGQRNALSLKRLIDE